MSTRMNSAFKSAGQLTTSRLFDFSEGFGVASIVGATLLTLFAAMVPLQAQELEPGSQSNSGLLDDFDRRTDSGFRLYVVDQPKTAAWADEGSVNEFSAASLQLHGPVNFEEMCARTSVCADAFYASRTSQSIAAYSDAGEGPGEGPKPESRRAARPSRPLDYGSTLYYKNKTEFGMEIGWLPINIPFVFDIFLGDGYNNPPQYYTLLPVFASVRWQMGDVYGPWILRGNWDLQASLGIVPIARGPESRYFAWIMGIRRNFVPHRGKIAPYWDFRIGLGGIDAKEPSGVIFAQGEDYTFTINMGSGVRYNFNQKYSISAGMNYMHISNLYLSEPRYPDYGINVYGPMVGFNVRLGKPHGGATE